MNTQVNLFMCLNSDCTCKGCTDLSISHQLGDIDKSKLVHSHNSKERQDCKKSYCRKYNQLGTKNILGLLYVRHTINFFVEHVKVHNNKGFCHLLYLAANHPLLLEVLKIEKLLKDFKSMRKVKYI